MGVAERAGLNRTAVPDTPDALGDQEAAGVYLPVMVGYGSYCAQECEVGGAEATSLDAGQAGSAL